MGGGNRVDQLRLEPREMGTICAVGRTAAEKEERPSKRFCHAVSVIFRAFDDLAVMVSPAALHVSHSLRVRGELCVIAQYSLPLIALAAMGPRASIRMAPSRFAVRRVLIRMSACAARPLALVSRP
jgi:hypothetical protein